MALKLWNTLTRRKEAFTPLDLRNVRLYVCGPTVYDRAHIGNARPVIVFDLLFRLLRHLYGADHVTYIRNITDVDDKINARAAEQGVPIGELTEATTRQFHEDIAALGVLPPTAEPRATEHVPAMIAMIARLIAQGFAYEAEGHVLFHVPAMADYGRLSGRSLEEMIAGARVDVAPYKRDPMDFVLWKPSAPELPGWDSPWGRGRPGWHIECSAMSWQHLGEVFDIHGGGIDLVFPHHENEIAQSRSAFGTPVMARVWMHNGFLQVEGEKMAKSAGNFVTIHELLNTTQFGGRKWNGRVLRLAMLMTHYHQPIDWTVRRLDEAQSRLDGWLGPVVSRGVPGKVKVPDELIETLQDDLNTPEALLVLDRLVARKNSPNEQDVTGAAADALAQALCWLGLASEEDFAGAKRERDKLRAKLEADYDIAARVAERTAARRRKDFATADRIRAELEAEGIQLMDTRDPETGELVTTWESKP
jgi:cysteinyl-tRNA synthetase